MYINTNLLPTEIAKLHFDEYPFVEEWAALAQQVTSGDFSVGDSFAGYQSEDCLQDDIIDPLDNLITNLSKSGPVNKKHLLEALKIIAESALNTQSRIHQEGEYAKGDLMSLEDRLNKLSI